MPGLNEVIGQISALSTANPQVSAPDVIRSGYITRLHQHTGRNIICYYSGWLSTNGNNASNLDINDMDKNGFMNAVEGMDCDLGLDLLLHTPGGSISAAESLVYYLKQKFGTNIRVIIPQMAMSSGTMIACSAKEIIMGHQSCIGPFDPSIFGVSAFAVFDEFERASKEIQEKPHTIPLWQVMIGKYPPAILEQCEKAIELAGSIVPKWLKEGMLNGLDEQEQDAIVANILRYLNNPSETKEHNRHIHFDKALEIGLKVVSLEDNDELQDIVLSVHHAYTATLMMTNTAKLIESHHGKRFILTF